MSTSAADPSAMPATVGDGARFGGTPTATRPTASAFNVVMTVVLLVTLPPLVYYLYVCLQFFDGRLAIPSGEWLHYIPAPTLTSAAIVGGWFLFQGLLQIYAPGAWIEGTPLHDGTRLQYKMNGWFTWWLTWACIVAGVALKLFRPSILADQFGPLMTTMNIFTYVFCVYLYIHGRRTGTDHERVTGNVIYDFWLGTALNPRVGRFDFKLFCEARPGLIGWVAINLSFAAKQYEVYGTLTTPMILVCLFHFWYIADYYFHEEAILTTWDIKHENFGFMLCWGDLVWVPFTYTIQAFYLVHHGHHLPLWAVVGIVLLNILGYVIFRGTNIQKHHFRKDPSRPVWGKPAQYIKTQKGSLLLVSGWWGLARHMNYFGDLLMASAWCLVTGFHTPVTYFYITYFTILLVHRERRDHDMCAFRYGSDWDAYCKKVPHRIIPGVY
jgi:protein-S-isoprenylcysteine O-methyltransferase Ste14